MLGAVIDTHAVIWYLNANPRLSDRAKTFIDEAGRRRTPVLVSPIFLVEVIYRQEKCAEHDQNERVGSAHPTQLLSPEGDASLPVSNYDGLRLPTRY